MIAAAGALIVVLVTVIVVTRLVGVAQVADPDDTTPPTPGATDLPLSTSVALNATPTVAVSKADWESGGVSFPENGERQEVFVYAGGSGDCAAIVSTLDDTDLGVHGDDAAASSRMYDNAVKNGLDIIEPPATVSLPTTDGGTLEFATFAADRGDRVQWSATRAFSGSGHVLVIAVVCDSSGDLRSAKASLIDGVRITLDRR